MKRTFRQAVNDGWKILREDIYGVRGVIIALALYFLFFRYILRSICPVVLVTGFPSSGLYRSLGDSSLYLPHHPSGGNVRLEPVYPVQDAPAVVEEMCGGAGGGHDLVLSVENVCVFSGGATHELLRRECYRQNPGTSIAFALVE